MMAKQKQLKRIKPKLITIFKVKNRKGYAAICLSNLTEGSTPLQAFRRLLHPLNRMGYELPNRFPKPRARV